MTTRPDKDAAKDRLMTAMQDAFVKAADYGMSVEDPIMIEMYKQFRRVEKLLGYEEGSWK